MIRVEHYRRPTKYDNPCYNFGLRTYAMDNITHTSTHGWLWSKYAASAVFFLFFFTHLPDCHNFPIISVEEQIMKIIINTTGHSWHRRPNRIWIIKQTAIIPPTSNCEHVERWTLMWSVQRLFVYPTSASNTSTTLQAWPIRHWTVMCWNLCI